MDIRGSRREKEHAQTSFPSFLGCVDVWSIRHWRSDVDSSVYLLYLSISSILRRRSDTQTTLHYIILPIPIPRYSITHLFKLL
jgi:hypothetical protein